MTACMTKKQQIFKMIKQQMTPLAFFVPVITRNPGDSCVFNHMTTGQV